MNIFDRIKQLKLIEPEARFAERSKRIILATLPPESPFRRVTLRQIFIRLAEAGVAGALVAIFLLVITTGVATSPLSPAPFAAVNPQALHAEAQAIDIQIKLAKLAYQASQETAESTVSGSVSPSNVLLSLPVSGTSTVAAANANATSSVSPSLSVDEALKALSQ
jgi:hypothetical protein